MNYIYNNSIRRAIASAIIASFLGISLAVLGDWNPKQEVFFIKLVFFVFFTIVNIIHIVICTTQDSKDISYVSELNKENTALKKALAGIIYVSESNSSEINKCIHQYLSENKLNNGTWNYINACNNLCATIFTIISDLTENENIEVSYVKLNEHTKDEIEMCSFYNSTFQKPKLLNKKRSLSKEDSIQYFDMTMFKNNSAETKVLHGSKEINIYFYRSNEGKQHHPNKYNQYIAIPVFCDKQKMIGLLQIACLYDCSLAEDSTVLLEIANKYFVPYANLFLLLHKMSKALKLGITSEV